MEISFKNKKVFITGASRGIGKEICLCFKKNGADVIAPDRNELDLADPDSINNYIEKKDLDVDVFVHCAGINILAGIDEITEENYKETFQVNVFSAIKLIQEAVKKMKEKNEGKIIFISSLYSEVSKERRISYSASKNAITGITKTLALELAPDNIMVNAIAPGYVMTDMTKKNLSAEYIKEIVKNIPTGRFQTEREIADMVMFLASEMNKSITGQLINVDGGFLCR